MILSRRGFIKSGVVVGGGLAIGMNLGGCGKTPPFPPGHTGALQPNAFLQLTPDNEFVLQIHRAEMGQGVTTGFATLAGEELNIAPAALRLEFAEVHPDFADPMMTLMITGGSNSLANSHGMVRIAAAAFRELLEAAGAKYWGIDSTQCALDSGELINRSSGARIKASQVIDIARTLPLNDQPKLKPPTEFRYIGKPIIRVDALAKVTGKARFGIDLGVEGAAIAVVIRSREIGATLAGFDDSKASEVPGFLKAFAISNGVAVLASRYWQARKAAQLVDVSWKSGVYSTLDDAGIRQLFLAALDREESEVMRDDGHAPAPSDQVTTISAEYHLPYLAHATMEPLSAVVSIKDGHCDIWAGNQGPDIVQAIAAKLLGIDRAKVRVHSAFIGSGFGRRVSFDYIEEAVEIAAAYGAPIKVMWSREDDLQHDFYRPAFSSRLSAKIQGKEVLSWQHKSVGSSVIRQTLPSIMTTAMPTWFPGGVGQSAASLAAGSDPSSVEGASDIPYAFPHINMQYTNVEPGLRVGYWRSVGHSHNAFVVETFIDELVVATGTNPLDFRRRLLAANPRHLGVLNKVAELAGWDGNESSTDVYRGLAIHESFRTVVAQIVELRYQNDKLVVDKVYAAIDCGHAINPDIIKAQMESCVVFALTATLYGQINISQGQVQQSNFHDYPLLRISECPEIRVGIVDSENPPTGVGEPGFPPLAPALANALYRATGRRQRELPFKI